MTMTKLAQLVNPQVMADIISAELPKKIKVAPLATIDNTLVGRPGNEITVPAYGYIGAADDVEEGAEISIAQMSTSTKKAKVKKAGKGVEITDESILSGYGDPVGEANKQLLMSIADKIDDDCMNALKGATLTHDVSSSAIISYEGIVDAVDKFDKQLLMSIADKIDDDCMNALKGATLTHDVSSSAIISYEGIVDAVDKFDEEDGEGKVIFIHPKQVTQLRKDPNFLSKDKYPLEVIMKGVIGEIAGCQVVVSKRVDSSASMYKCPIVKAGALTIYMKRGAEVETDRDIIKKTTVITADEHYTAVLSDETKVVLAKFKDTPAM